MAPAGRVVVLGDERLARRPRLVAPSGPGGSDRGADDQGQPEEHGGSRGRRRSKGSTRHGVITSEPVGRTSPARPTSGAFGGARPKWSDHPDRPSIRPAASPGQPRDERAGAPAAGRMQTGATAAR